MAEARSRPFTGRHMAMILLVFFGVVIAVNLVMARMAVGSFGGTVVDNSYVASQNFNSWLAQARAEQALGWQIDVWRDDAGRLVLAARDATGAPLPAVQANAVARHPLGAVPERTLHFAMTDSGHLRSAAAPGPGRWQLVVTVQSGEARMRLAKDIA